jgi:hypothetical protein
MTGPLGPLTAALIGPALIAGLAIGLGGPQAKPAATADDPAVRIPFRAGEQLTFGLKVGVLNAGSATLKVVGIEAIRGTPTYHTTFDIKGKVLFKKVENHYESWFDTTTMTSLRHVQRVDDGESEDKDYTFHPERRIYIRNGEERPSVAKPLDEGSLLYYLRSIPLEPGHTYTIHRYYNAERNPVVVRVIRREKVRVAAGEFDAILVEPVVKSRGLFGEAASAQVWISDDARRLPLRLKSKLPVGTLTMELREIR